MTVNMIKTMGCYMMMAAVIAATAAVLFQTPVKAADFSDAEYVHVNVPVVDNVNKGYWDEKNLYRFSTKTDGCVKVNFKCPLQADASCYWKLTLYGGDYSQIDEMYVTGNKANHDMTAMGLSAGTYFVGVSSSHINYARSKDVYQITINYSASKQWEKEPNDDFSKATKIKRNKTYFGTTKAGSGQEKDYYRFTVGQSGIYSVHMTIPQQENASVYWILELYNHSYQKMDRSQIIGNKTDQGIIKRLSKGSYYAVVKSGHAGRSMSKDVYQIKVNAVDSQWDDTEIDEQYDESDEDDNADDDWIEADKDDDENEEMEDRDTDDENYTECEQSNSAGNMGNANQFNGKQRDGDGDGKWEPEIFFERKS